MSAHGASLSLMPPAPLLSVEAGQLLPIRLADRPQDVSKFQLYQGLPPQFDRLYSTMHLNDLLHLSIRKIRLRGPFF